MFKIITIKKINRQAKVLIEIEDYGVLTCSEDLIYKYNISIGKQMQNQELEQIIAEQKKFDIKRIALNYVSYKPRTEYQVRQKLLKHGYSLYEAEYSIQFLKDFGYLDDYSFAFSFSKDFLKRNPSGERRLRQELRKRGISKEIVDNVCTITFDIDRTYTMALQSAHKKLKAISYKPIEKQKTSLIQYLQRQGFNWDVIKRIVDEVAELKK